MLGPRVVRRKDLDLSLNLKTEQFLKTPDASQANWLISRSMDELADDLVHLDSVSKRFVSGSKRKEIFEDWVKSQAKYDDTQLIIDGQQVMQDWERPYMEAMAKVATKTKGDVLEIGFGMGISASYMLAMGVKSYTVIECNEDVRMEFEKWKKNHPKCDVSLVFGKWQEVIGELGLFDAIFFDTYPLSEIEFEEYVSNSVTFAEHFFEAAASHLKDGGVFTYYSNEIDSVSRRHQRALFKYFKEVSFSICSPLFPPEDCNYWWADSMIVTKCVK